VSIEAAARKGLSILIAPERARLDARSVGPFKRRAKLNPGTVDIAVLPPVSVEGWTPASSAPMGMKCPLCAWL
jgi:putative phosphoserine phosphatase/1-acylglycerol-3-phosphate O-acyltransferase